MIIDMVHTQHGSNMVVSTPRMNVQTVLYI